VTPHAQNARATEQDVAVIAAALAYCGTQRVGPTNHREPQSKWKIAGREATLAGSVIRKAQ
jgi:hypothetical protein